MGLIYCKDCGRQISDAAQACPYCGSPLKDMAPADPNKSPKDWLTTLLLCFFLGTLGIHSFYVGKTVIGVVQLITLGGCGIWTLVDFIMILCGSYKDSEGKIVRNN
ncbi:MAG: NINE protein [Alistipes sp.]|nr:NINE protein [Alistipes sp.]